MSQATFRLPDFVKSCPFPLHQNPHLEAIAPESNNWISSFDIHSNDAHRVAYESCAFGLLVAYCYPTANAERFRILCDFINALFSFDDLMDEEHLMRDVKGTQVVMDIAMNALWHPESYRTDFRVGQAVQSFWDRAIKLGCSHGTQRRFLEYMDQYCAAVHEQVINRSKNKIMDVESFIKMRRDTGALRICFVMGEFGLGLDLPDEVFQHPLIKVMEDCANDVVVLANDIYSWNLEQAQGHFANIITVLMKEKNIPVQAAMSIAAQEVYKRFNLYQSSKAQLPSWGAAVDRDVLAYATVLESWMMGNFVWSLTTERYFGKNAPTIRKTLQVLILPREHKTATDLRNAEATTTAKVPIVPKQDALLWGTFSLALMVMASFLVLRLAERLQPVRLSFLLM